MVKSTLFFALAGLSGLMHASPVHQQHQQQQHKHRAVAGGGRGKRGVAFPKNCKINEVKYGPGGLWTRFFEGSNQVTWMYDWEAEIDGPAAKSLDYFPLLHNGDAVFLNSFKSVTSGGKFTTVLSINEPDQCGGGGTCMKINAAVTAHVDATKNLPGNVRVGSPAVTNGEDTNANGDKKGIAYLQNFMSACTTQGCRVDFMVAHWYGDNIADFKKHINAFHAAFPGKPVWITEFALNAGKGDASKFLQDALQWLDDPKQSWIEKYAYHMAAPDVAGLQYLVNSDMSGLTAAGKIYVS